MVSCLIGAICPGMGEGSAWAPMLPDRTTQEHATVTPTIREYPLIFFLCLFISNTCIGPRIPYLPA